MVYYRYMSIHHYCCSEVDLNGSLWYTRASKRNNINLLDALAF